MKYLACVSVFAAMTGCMASAGGGDGGDGLEQDVSSTTYVDILDYSKTDQGAWYDTIHALNAQFNQECGDTFCEGDWSNLVPLTFGVEVTSQSHLSWMNEHLTSNANFEVAIGIFYVSLALVAATGAYIFGYVVTKSAPKPAPRALGSGSLSTPPATAR